MSEDVKVKGKREYDTFSITMELERPLLYDEVENNSETKEKNPKLKKSIFKVIIGILIMSIIGFFIWISNSYKPQGMAKLALVSDNLVEVINEDFLSFTPKNIKPTKGFIFYPGARVEPEAYAPLCRAIAENGYEVIVAEMPFNFAMFAQNKANKIIKKYENIEHWAIGGHSLGGVAASKFASDNNIIDGVVLLASYPTGNDLKNLGKDVLSIWGSKDGVVNFKNLIEAKEKLPKDTTFFEIEGANHAQFGDYGKQKGDNDATISQEKQLDITYKNIVKFLEKMN